MISGLNSHAVRRNVILIRNRRLLGNTMYKNNCRKMHIADLILLWLQNSHYKNIPGTSTDKHNTLCERLLM